MKRETELSQPLGHIAELGTENKHGSSSKHSYNPVFCVLLIFSVRFSLAPNRAPRVPPRVQWEAEPPTVPPRVQWEDGPRIPGVQWRPGRAARVTSRSAVGSRAARGADYFCCVPETAVNPLTFVFHLAELQQG